MVISILKMGCMGEMTVTLSFVCSCPCPHCGILPCATAPICVEGRSAAT